MGAGVPAALESTPVSLRLSVEQLLDFEPILFELCYENHESQDEENCNNRVPGYTHE